MTCEAGTMGLCFTERCKFEGFACFNKDFDFLDLLAMLYRIEIARPMQFLGEMLLVWEFSDAVWRVLAIFVLSALE